MNISVGVTDSSWATFLRDHSAVSEANFWVPSGRNFISKERLGQPFLFKTKAPRNQLIGGGFLTGFWELRVSQAWTTFGLGNGVASEDELLARMQVYWDRNAYARRHDPTIGCLVLRNLFFARPGDELAQPEHWGRSIVQGKTYRPSDRDYEYVAFAFQSLQDGVRLDAAWDRDLRIEVERYGRPLLTRARLGQGAFRLSVLDAYRNRCVVTDSHTEPVLDAAHIRPYAEGGNHVISNGLALRTDMHRLFDRGYIGVDERYRLRVSPQLEAVYGNGVDLYERERRGQVIELPTRQQDLPDPAALAWHMEHRFRAC